VKTKKKFAGKSQMILVLRLYVAGQTPKSLAAISNLKKICSEHFEAKCKIEVIDLLKKPGLAKDHQILSLFPPWCVPCPYQSAKSSGICRTPSAS